LKVNLEKCVYGNQEVSYLGFTLTPQGIKPGWNELQAIKEALTPTNVKMSFVGLCNFFCMHTRDFATIAARFLKSQEKILDTNLVHCYQTHCTLSKFCNNNSFQDW